MKIIIKFMMLGILLQSSVAIAFTGNDVMGWDKYNRLYYVMGVIDATPVEAIPACAPIKSITYEQYDAILIKYLTDFPQVRHLEAPKLFLYSIHNAFPCQTKDKIKNGIEQKF